MDISEIMIDSSYTILGALRKIDLSGKKILVVVNDAKELVATVTDGDIRRWILKKGDLNSQVSEIMNKNPIYLFAKEKYKAKQLMRRYLIEAIPIIDEKRRFISVVLWHEENSEVFNHYERLKNPVVIMAGGKGTRLYPYTKILPKPLIPIGDTPIIERIINNFAEYGCDNFYLTVNHKKNMIKAYFNEMEKNYKISYVEEDKPLGTGGSLYLLKDTIKETFFVSNCDILIEANYSDILKYHREQKNDITIVTSLRRLVVPYGVIELNDNGTMKGAVEKPEYNILVNTGMYVMEPEVLSDIPEDKFFNLPELSEKYVKEYKKVGVYPVSEKSWLDMGQIEEMENMIKRLGDSD